MTPVTSVVANAGSPTRYSLLAEFRRYHMIKKLSTLIVATLFLAACATTTDDPNAKAKRGAGIGAAAGAIAGAIIGNQGGNPAQGLSLIHISEPTRLGMIS